MLLLWCFFEIIINSTLIIILNAPICLEGLCYVAYDYVNPSSPYISVFFYSYIVIVVDFLIILNAPIWQERLCYVASDYDTEVKRASGQSDVRSTWARGGDIRAKYGSCFTNLSFSLYFIFYILYFIFYILYFILFYILYYYYYYYFIYLSIYLSIYLFVHLFFIFLNVSLYSCAYTIPHLYLSSKTRVTLIFVKGLPFCAGCPNIDVLHSRCSWPW
jgi:hypothetical protein